MSTDTTIGRYMAVRPVGDGWIVLTREGLTLGRVAWLARWRQYEFLPATGSGYSGGCCRDMAAFLDKVTRERKQASQAAGANDAHPPK